MRDGKTDEEKNMVSLSSAGILYFYSLPEPSGRFLSHLETFHS